MLNLTARPLTFRGETGELVVLQPSPLFGENGLALEELRGAEYEVAENGVKIFLEPTYVLPDFDPVTCAALAPGTVLVMTMIVAQAVVAQGGRQRAFGRKDVVIASPASGPNDVERHPVTKEIIACKGLIKYVH